MCWGYLLGQAGPMGQTHSSCGPGGSGNTLPAMAQPVMGVMVLYFVVTVISWRAVGERVIIVAAASGVTGWINKRDF